MDKWAAKHGREPSKRELLYIRQEVTMASREGKEDGAIDWDAQTEKWEAKWDARDGVVARAGRAGGVASARPRGWRGGRRGQRPRNRAARP